MLIVPLLTCLFTLITHAQSHFRSPVPIGYLTRPDEELARCLIYSVAGSYGEFHR
jgi:hypothetical protein